MQRSVSSDDPARTEHLKIVSTLLARIEQDKAYGQMLMATKLGLRIPKRDVVKLLMHYFPEGKIQAQSLWRVWKRDLQHPVVIGGTAPYVNFQFLVQCDPYEDVMVITPIPEFSEVKETAKIVQEQLPHRIHERIVALTQPASVELVNNILTSPAIPWIRGFELSPTMSRDGGRDFRVLLKLDKDGIISTTGRGKEQQFFGQLKHYSKKAGSPDIDKFSGSLSRLPFGQRRGLFISTLGFSPDAYEAIRQSPWPIIAKDSWWLVELMLKYAVGLQRVTLRATQFDEIFWKELKTQT